MPRVSPERRAPRKVLQIAGAAAVLSLILAGCSVDAPIAGGPTPAVTPSMTTPTQPEPSEPTLVPDGTAEDNLPLFRSIVESVAASPDAASGRAYIDALVASGFDKAAMQVTADQSTVRNAAESIQFSVLWGQECLIGQVGPATGAPHIVVIDALPEGGCLIGQTRPIDW